MTCFHRPLVAIQLWTSGPVSNESDRKVFLSVYFQRLSDTEHSTDSGSYTANDLLLSSPCLEAKAEPDSARVHGTAAMVLPAHIPTCRTADRVTFQPSNTHTHS
jgi:hypothetical protein